MGLLLFVLCLVFIIRQQTHHPNEIISILIIHLESSLSFIFSENTCGEDRKIEKLNSEVNLLCRFKQFKNDFYSMRSNLEVNLNVLLCKNAEFVSETFASISRRRSEWFNYIQIDFT